MEVEPYGSQCWQASTDYPERELDVCPEEDGRSIVDDVVRMFDVFVCDGVGSDNAGDADSAYTVLLAMNIVSRVSH
jgi:hypothetical protein